MVLPGGVGVQVGDVEGTHCLRIPPLPGHLLQVSGVSSCRRGRQLADSGAQPPALKEEVGAATLGVDQGGSGCQDIGRYIFSDGASGPVIRVRDMGPDTAYAKGVGRIPPYSGPQADETATTEGMGRRLGLSPTGRCYGRGGVAGSGDLRLPPPEHRGTIYCN